MFQLPFHCQPFSRKNCLLTDTSDVYPPKTLKIDKLLVVININYIFEIINIFVSHFKY